MKKSNNFIILLVLLVMPFGCEKVPFDYRNIYIGDYDFTIYISKRFFNPDSIEYDTMQYHGQVSYGSDYTDKTSIKIKYLINAEFETQVKKNGQFKYGAFSGDSIQMGDSYIQGGLPKPNPLINYNNEWWHVIGIKRK